MFEKNQRALKEFHQFKASQEYEEMAQQMSMKLNLSDIKSGEYFHSHWHCYWVSFMFVYRGIHCWVFVRDDFMLFLLL